MLLPSYYSFVAFGIGTLGLTPALRAVDYAIFLTHLGVMPYKMQRTCFFLPIAFKDCLLAAFTAEHDAEILSGTITRRYDFLYIVTSLALCYHGDARTLTVPTKVSNQSKCSFLIITKAARALLVGWILKPRTPSLLPGLVTR